MAEVHLVVVILDVINLVPNHLLLANPLLIVVLVVKLQIGPGIGKNVMVICVK